MRDIGAVQNVEGSIYGCGCPATFSGLASNLVLVVLRLSFWHTIRVIKTG